MSASREDEYRTVVQEILFSPPVIACLVVAGCAAFGVSVVLRFVPDKRKLDRTMARAEKALAKIRRRLAEKKALIKQLEEEVAMLKPVHDRLDHYHAQLAEINLEYERRELAEDDGKRREEREDDLLGERKRPTVA